MISHIVGVGCSWIAGDEIDHPTAAPNTKEHRLYREQNCTLGQLANMLDVSSVDNFGISGGSLQSTQWEFARWELNYFPRLQLTPADVLVVVGLTESSRTSWFTNNKKSRYMHSHWVHPGDTWEDFVKFHTVNADNEQVWAMNYWTTVNFFRGHCTRLGYKLCMFNVFPPAIRMPDIPQWNARGFVHQKHAVEKDCLAPGHHANEKGSKFLAEKLLSLINIDE